MELMPRLGTDDVKCLFFPSHSFSMSLMTKYIYQREVNLFIYLFICLQREET